MRRRNRITTAAVALIVLGAAIVFLVLLARQRGTDCRNLVLITIDTVRADYLGFYGYPLTVSPNLDRLAQASVVFEKAYSTAPFTGPAHASILTSQHPSTHGIVFNGHRKPKRIRRKSHALAQHLHDAGYSTGAFVSVECLDKKYGFGQGFEEFQLVKITHSSDNGSWGKKISEFAKKWLKQNYHRPFFLWIHYYDPHLRYVCPDNIYKELRIPRSVLMGRPKEGESPPQNIRDAYRAEVCEMDKYIGEFLATLDHFDLRSSTVIAVVADHGEHGLYDHSRLYEEVIQVPMMISTPNMDKTIRRKDLVSIIDLTPTLLKLLAVDPLPGAQGRDLLAPLASRQNIPAFSEWRDFRILNKHNELRPDDFLISVQHQQYKLILSMISKKSKMLFNLIDDPRENNNLAEKNPDLVKQMEQIISLHVKNDLPSGLIGAEDVQISSESMEMLKSLGYVQ